GVILGVGFDFDNIKTARCDGCPNFMAMTQRTGRGLGVHSALGGRRDTIIEAADGSDQSR
ncbi:MAG: hypothetical protein WAL40_16975, partial [Rhodoplanes sp.]